MTEKPKVSGSFERNPDGTYNWIPSPPEEPNDYLLALSYKQVERLPDADGKQSRK